MNKIILPVLLFTVLLLNTAFANAGLELIRNSDGKARYVTHYEATGVNPTTEKKERADLCEVSGKGRLPTIRELALESQSKGAKGILELNQVDPKNLPTGYKLIAATNLDGKRDQFYFSWEGFDWTGFASTTGVRTSDWIWSSSLFTMDVRFAYFLGAAIGDLGHFYRNDADDGLAVVLCIGK